MRLRLIIVTAAAASLCFLSIAQAQSSPRTFSEPHVIRSLRLLHSAQATYQATTGNGNYGSLQNLRQAGLIDEALASGRKYKFLYVVSTSIGPARFTVSAVPERYRKTGIRSFFINDGGEIRGADRQGAPSTPTDPVIDDCTSGSILLNERCTILDMRLIASAQATYTATAGNGNYATLPQLYLAGLIGADLSDNASRGYLYTVDVIPQKPGSQPASFKVWATPATWGVTGIRSFYVDTTGVLRGADRSGAPAGPGDPPIQNELTVRDR